jgi:group I intron endonuclease
MGKLVVYLIKNLVNGKVYVGSSSNFEDRKKRHLRLLEKNKHHSKKIQHSWNKYGKDNFIFDILEYVNDLNDLKNREQFYIDLFESYNDEYGYNICKKSDRTIGYKHTDETKIRLQKSHLGVKKGEPSKETKKKISIALKNRDSRESVEKRKHTLLMINEKIFKIIGEKSSITQKKNGLNKGMNNPNSNKSDVLIIDNNDNVIHVTNNFEFDDLCRKFNLPKRVLIKSKISNGEYKLFDKLPPKNKDFIQYKGWYCKYKN